MDNIRSVLCEAQSDIQSALSVFKTATDLEAEDEFEMEMLLDDLASKAAKVRDISTKYKRADSGVGDVTDAIALSHISGDSLANKAELNTKDENSNSVQDLEQIMLSSDSLSQKSDAASDKTEEFPSPPAETSPTKENRVDAPETTVDDSMAMDDDDGFDDFSETDLQLIDAAESSFMNEAVDDAEVLDLTDETEEEEAEDFQEEDLDPTHQPSDPKYLKALKEHFGYNKFRPLQWKIINSVLNENKDNCVIMATGRGKSLCYQFPSVITGRITVVVSPLISLMEDQVLALNAVNINACFMGSAQQNSSMIRQGLMRGEYRVVYMTPEFITSADSFLKELNQAVGIDLVAIDEAHCVSQWGHDFRNAYRDLGRIRTILPKVPIMALTATATPQVSKDICTSLTLKNPVVTCSSFDRPNLYLSVSLKSGNSIRDLNAKISAVSEGAIIIYCPTRKSAEEVNSVVQNMGHACELYHAGLPFHQRKSVHKKFVDDEIRVVVATVAFGMGIDKPDVRLVIHYGAPKDIESYYQEIGRGGRDGQRSTCHVFYSSGDFNTNRFFLKDISNQKFLQHKTLMLKKMEEYLTSVTCRRRAILSHFENKSVKDVGGTSWCCDNCTEKMAARQAQLQGLPARHISDAKQNLGREAMDLLKAVKITGERFGLGTPILFLRGSQSQKLPAHCQSHAAFGQGKYRSEKWWKIFARQIMNMGYLKEVRIQGGFGSTVEMTAQGNKWLQSQRRDPELMMMPNKELQQLDIVVPRPAPSLVPSANPKSPAPGIAAPRILPIVPQNTWTSTKDTFKKSQPVAAPVDPTEMKNQRDLYAKMITTRNELSQETGLPSFVLFSNKSLLDLAKYRPTTLDNMLKIEEIAVAKAQKYGAKLLDLIKQFCAERNWKTDHFEQDVRVAPKMSSREEAALNNLSETVGLTYHLFEREAKSLETVATNRGLKTVTICGHLCEAIKKGLPVDIDRLGVTDAIIQQVTDAIRKPPINSDISRLTPIKDQLPDYIEFNHIKVVLAMLQHRFGMTDNRLDDAGADETIRKEAKTPLAKSHSAPPQSSQGIGSGTKRKLPSWMGQSSNKKTSNKAKKNFPF